MSDQRPPIEEFELRMPDDLDVQHCYRHPDRETGVSCSNCGKPICHECMTPAPVGFRCPDCMAQQRHGSGRAKVITRQQTRSRWQSGSLLGAGGSPVTRALIVLNVLVFVADMMTNGALLERGALFAPYIVLRHEYWRLVTPMFLHANVLHILFNMYALYVLGSYMEALAGSRKFLAIYLVSGLAGNVAAFLLAPTLTSTVGASTAIYGIFGAFFMYSYHNRADLAANMMMRQIGMLIVINLVITFAIPGISWQGHIGGLAGGVVMLEALTRFGGKSLHGAFDREDLMAVLACLGVLVALTWWHIQNFVA